MAKLTPMAPDSAGFKVLVRLHDLGGEALVDQLTEVLWKEFRSFKRFHQVAANPLVERGLISVVQAGQRLLLKPEGRLLVDNYLARMPAPRTPKPHVALNLKTHFRYEERRPGSLDYREQPSVMGEERVAYTGSYSGVGDK